MKFIYLRIRWASWDVFYFYTKTLDPPSQLNAHVPKVSETFLTFLYCGKETYLQTFNGFCNTKKSKIYAVVIPNYSSLMRQFFTLNNKNIKK